MTTGNEMVRATADAMEQVREFFNNDQKAMIRAMYAREASPEEFKVLLEIARARRLNPLLKQIHFVKRDGKWSAQASIDGLRAIAERTGKYDGQDEPEFERDEKGKLVCAKVKVYRKDWARPAVGIAYYTEYVQRTREGEETRFWKTMPHVMLAKCAEALAFRKAFPEDMSGLYTPEEMQQADNPPDVPAVSPHGHVEEGETFARTEEEADIAIRAIQEAETKNALSDALHALAWTTPEDLEQWHPDHRKAISSAYKRRERQLAKEAT